MKRLFIISAIIAAAIVGSSASARAQGGIVVTPPHVIVCAVSCHGIITIILADGTTSSLSSEASGTATFESVASSNNDDGTVAFTRFTPVSITVDGDDAVYGHYSFQFDVSKQVNNTVITANQVGADFPATCDVYANVTGTISGIAGTFTNQSECHIRSANVQTFNPQHSEVYTFVDGVQFSNGAGTTFIIPASSVVTLN